MKKLRKGSRVEVVTGNVSRAASVVAHGRDQWGVYTEVRFENGSVDRYHPDNVKPRRAKS